jgi:hypothetical protein
MVEGTVGNVVDVLIVVIQEGVFRSLPPEVASMVCETEPHNYRLATPAECDQYEQAKRKAQDVRE